MIALVAAAGLLAAMALTLLRLIAGPTLYDRALAAHAIVFLAALAIAAIAAYLRAPHGVDAAIALIGADLILALTTLKYFRFHSLQPPLSFEETDS